MILDIVLLICFILGAIGSIYLLKRHDEIDKKRFVADSDFFDYVFGGTIGILGLAVFSPCVLVSIWLILLDLGWV